MMWSGREVVRRVVRHRVQSFSAWPPKVYRPGQVIRLKRVWRSAPEELGAQSLVGMGLCVVLVVLPLAYALQSRPVEGSSAGKQSTEVLQRLVYEKRLEHRRTE